GTEAARDDDRLDERLLVVEERQHQRAVVIPPDGAEGVGSTAPVLPLHRVVRVGDMAVDLDLNTVDGGPRRGPRPPARDGLLALQASDDSGERATRDWRAARQRP